MFIARSYLTRGAHVLDCERGLATIEQAVTWTSLEHTAGRTPGLYVDVDRWPALRSALQLSRVAFPWFWVAHWGIHPVLIPPCALGVQYANSTLSGGHFDLSRMAAHIPGVDPRPAPVIVKGIADVELNEKVRPYDQVKGSGTVEEALAAVMQGESGKRVPGALFADVAELGTRLGLVMAQVNVISQHLGLPTMALAAPAPAAATPLPVDAPASTEQAAGTTGGEQ
jgi:hypothetical protein